MRQPSTIYLSSENVSISFKTASVLIIVLRSATIDSHVGSRPMSVRQLAWPVCVIEVACDVAIAPHLTESSQIVFVATIRTIFILNLKEHNGSVVDGQVRSDYGGDILDVDLHLLQIRCIIGPQTNPRNGQ